MVACLGVERVVRVSTGIGPRPNTRELVDERVAALPAEFQSLAHQLVEDVVSPATKTSTAMQ